MDISSAGLGFGLALSSTSNKTSIKIGQSNSNISVKQEVRASSDFVIIDLLIILSAMMITLQLFVDWVILSI